MNSKIFKLLQGEGLWKRIVNDIKMYTIYHMASLEKQKDKHTELFLQSTQPRDHMTTHTSPQGKREGQKKSNHHGGNTDGSLKITKILNLTNERCKVKLLHLSDYQKVHTDKSRCEETGSRGILPHQGKRRTDTTRSGEQRGI